MDQGATEKRLTITYFLCIIVGAISSITPGIAWGHWKDTLNQCAYDRNCSCILYGEHTITTFVGKSSTLLQYMKQMPSKLHMFFRW